MSAEPITIRTMAPVGATQDQLLQHMRVVMAAEGAALVVVNSPGRDGIEAAKLALRDPADGRHFLMSSAYAVNYYPAYADVGYRREDFVPVLGVGAYNFVHVTSAENPWRDLGAALAAIKAEGRALRFAGVGEVDLLVMKALAKRFGVSVEFKQTGGPPLLAAVLAREVDVGVGTGTHEPLLRQGKVRVLAQLHPRATRENGAAPSPEWVEFWLGEARTPEMLVELCRRFPDEARGLTGARPLLKHAMAGDLAALRPALDAEVRAEQAKDRAYWEPLKRELESLRWGEAHEREDPKAG